MFTFVLMHWRRLGLLSVALLLVYSGWHARGVVEEARLARELAAYQDRAEKARKQAQALEVKLANINSKFRPLRGDYAQEFQRPDYHACRVPAGGVQLINAAANASTGP